MADAFRGLTIRLGADARPLNSAINSITKSAGQAQQQMNLLSKALKFDPSNTRAIANMVDLAGDKAVHSARQVQTLRTALGQAAAESKELFDKSKYKDIGIKKLASQTRDAYAETQKLRSGYNHVDAELQHIYDAMKRVMVSSKEWGKVNSFDKANKVVNALRNQLNGIGPKADKARASLEKLLRIAAFEDNVGRLFGLEGHIGDGTRMVAIWDRLVTAQKDYKNNLEAVKKAEGFRAVENQVIAATSAVREAAAETARFKSQLYAFGGKTGIARAVTEAKQLDNAVEQALHTAEEMKAAFKFLPGSIEAANAKAKSFADAENAVHQKIVATRNAIKAIESSPGFDKLKAHTINAAVAVEKLESEFAKTEVKARLLGSAIERLEAEAEELKRLKPDGWTAELAKIEHKLDGARDAAAGFESKLNGIESEMRQVGAINTWQQQRNELIKYKAEIEKLNFQKSIFSKFGGIGQAFRQFGYGLYASVTPAIMMAGRYAIQAADQIDASYRDMRKTVNGTEEDFEHLKDAAIEFSRTHVTSADQMLDIEAIGGQLGISVKDLEAFAHTVSNLDIATNMDTEDIALNLAKLSNIMHFGQEKYDSFADSLVRLGNNEPALESDIMKISTRFAGMASNVGMSTADMLAFATAATATGQKAEAAGGSMQRTIGRIEKAVASGGEGLEQYAKISGMTADEFKATWEDVDNHGPATALKAFVNGLHEVNASGGSVTKTLADLGITGVRDTQLLEGLSNTTDVLSDSLRMSNDAWNGVSTTINGATEEAGDAMREAERKSEGFSGELAKMKNNAAALAVEVGEGAAPWIKTIGEGLKDLTGWFKSLSPEVKQNIVGFAGFVAAMGPVSVGLGTILSSIGNVYSVMKSGQGVFTGWAAKLNMMNISTERGMKANLGLQKALDFVGSTKGMFAIAGIALTVAAVANAFEKARVRAENYKKATEGMLDAAKNTPDILAEQEGGFKAATHEVNKNAKSMDELTASNAQAADAMKQKNDAAQSEIGALNSAYGVIDKYLNKTIDSVGAQGQFRAAVERVNEICGTQYSVIDAANGKLADENGHLLDNITQLRNYVTAKREAIRADALSENLKTAYEQQAESIKTYSNEYAKYQQKIIETNEAVGRSQMSQEEADAVLKEQWSYVEGAKSELDAVNATITSYETQLGELEASNQSAVKSVRDLANASIPLSSLFSDSGTAFEEFKNQLEDYGLSTQDFESITDETWAQVVAKWDGGANDLGMILDGMGIKSRSAVELFNAEMGKTSDGGNAFAQMCDNLKVKEDEFAQKLTESGISAQQMAATGSQAFQALYNSSDQNLALVKNKIDAINQSGITVKVDDGQLTYANGKLIDFDNFRLGEKTVKVTANGIEEVKQKAQEVKAETEEVDDTDATVTINEEGGQETIETSEEVLDLVARTGQTQFDITFNVNAEEATAAIDEVTESLSKVKPKPASVAVNNKTAISAINNVKDALKSVKDKSVKVSANVSGKSSVDALKSSIEALQSKTIYVTTIKETKTKQASGGINMTPMYGIPAYATGGAINGIVRKAMVTNQGLVGEAGTEALVRMGRQTAVVPLSNRRYVRPFARAIASEMGSGAVQSTVMNVYLDGKFVAGGVSESTTLGELAVGLRRKARA